MFAIVDCKNFYASCERVFDPSLRKRPVVVLSNNDGCVIARSDEAKSLGFKMGDPFFKVKDVAKRHGVAVFSSNYTLYGDMSQRVMQTLGMFSPEVEIYSIDEAFLGLGGFDAERLAAFPGDARSTVRQWTGITVNVGIGHTKTLAKVANQIAKKDPAAGGIWSIASEHDRLEALKKLAIGDVWGIGRQWAKRLAAEGVVTAFDFTRLSDSWIRRHLTVVGLRTAMELRGEPCIPLELAPPPRKCLVVSRMFGMKLADYEPVQQALIAYVTRSGEKLRREGRQTRHMTVFLHTSRFDKREPYYANSASFQLPFPTSDTAELIRHACSGLKRIFKPGFHYCKCGVMLTELSPASVKQGDFFDAGDSEESRRRMQALDAINRKLGRNTVFYAGSGIEKEWAATARMKSPAYTTDWNQIIKVFA